VVRSNPVSEFEAQRTRLFGLAYRLLGSAMEAEDVVQDAFLRWNGADPATIASPPAWLARVVTNLCLNRLTAARAQREQYIGPWLPEPVLTADGALGPLETAEQRDSISLALLMVLERLTPTERAVFVLREAFGYSHREIAETLGLSETNCRQLYGRARRRLTERQPRFRPDPDQHQRLVERFLSAAQLGDLPALEQMLTAGIVYRADGGGKGSAARRPVIGQDRVARLFVGLLAKYTGALALSFAEVNGEPAVLAWQRGNLLGVLMLEIVDGQIAAVCNVVNPEKLRFAARQVARLSHSGDPSGS